jgi:hypothetical protein
LIANGLEGVLEGQGTELIANGLEGLLGATGDGIDSKRPFVPGCAASFHFEFNGEVHWGRLVLERLWVMSSDKSLSHSVT